MNDEVDQAVVALGDDLGDGGAVLDEPPEVPVHAFLERRKVVEEGGNGIDGCPELRSGPHEGPVRRVDRFHEGQQLVVVVVHPLGEFAQLSETEIQLFRAGVHPAQRDQSVVECVACLLLAPSEPLGERVQQRGKIVQGNRREKVTTQLQLGLELERLIGP